MKLRRKFAMEMRKIFATKRRKTYAIALVVIFVIGIAVLLDQRTAPNLTNTSGTSSLSVSNASATMARYTVNSSPTGQWLVVDATSPVLSVSASNTGNIPAYSSLASLNQTSIGRECSQPAGDGLCNSYTDVQQTGWFWDSTDNLLTVHYLGGVNVTLTVVERP